MPHSNHQTEFLCKTFVGEVSAESFQDGNTYGAMSVSPPHTVMDSPENLQVVTLCVPFVLGTLSCYPCINSLVRMLMCFNHRILSFLKKLSCFYVTENDNGSYQQHNDQGLHCLHHEVLNFHCQKVFLLRWICCCLFRELKRNVDPNFAYFFYTLASCQLNLIWSTTKIVYSPNSFREKSFFELFTHI